MGYLHEGHMSLIREGRSRGDFLVVSIYVNPLQFAPSEDLESYPRSPERDASLCERAGADVLFLPGPDALYPNGYQTTVSMGALADSLCGASRPGHFDGVCTVVLKLFNLVAPRYAIFGSKDYQQLQVIRAMVRDLNLDVDVVGMPIVREIDGLAMSSRNAYLSASERSSALCLSESLALAEQLVAGGEHGTDVILAAVRGHVEAQSLAEVDYVELVDASSLRPVSGKIKAEAVIALAVRFGATRLIDNRVLRLSQPGACEANLGI